MDIAERIKRLRELYNITANELAEITGIHPVSIRKYETNKMVPGIEVIDKMCNALNLSRMVFEGIPKQNTDFHFTGDFFQVLFLLLANNTLNAEGPFSLNLENRLDETYFTLNPLLSKYIKIWDGDTEIPLENLTITLNTDDDMEDNSIWFNSYLYNLSHSFTEVAEKQQFDLMLTDHGWKEHLKGFDSYEDSQIALQKVLDSGGTLYDYIEQLEVPESVKNQLIGYYEDDWIFNHLTGEPFPAHEDFNTRLNWVMKRRERIKQYKKEHPKYKEEIKNLTINEAKSKQK